MQLKLRDVMPDGATLIRPTKLLLKAKRIYLKGRESKRCRWSGVKIDEPLTADRGRPQGSGRRGRPAWMQARP